MTTTIIVIIKTKIKGKIAKCMLNVNKQTNRYGMSNEINR